MNLKRHSVLPTELFWFKLKQRLLQLTVNYYDMMGLINHGLFKSILLFFIN